MDNEEMQIVVNLCKEIVLALELDPIEEIVYDADMFKNFLYVTYLDWDKRKQNCIDVETCDNFRNNFALFVMLQKQTANSLGLMIEVVNGALALVAESINEFLEGIVLKKNKDTLLILLDNVINSINKANVQESLKSFVSGSILKEQHHIQLLLSDLDTSPSSPLCTQAQKAIQKKLQEWETQSESILAGNTETSPISALNNCKANSKDIEYLIASVNFI